MTQYIITSSSPTTNGDLHLGHVSGPFLGADIFRRFKSLTGHNAIYICSSDDNQCYVIKKAQDEGRTIVETVDDYSERIQNTLRLANVKTSEFTRPFRKEHTLHTQEFFLKLFNNNALKVVEEESSYCENCSRYLFEALIRGICPTCKAPSGGSGCEACGSPNNPANLIEAVCTSCGNDPIKKTEKKIIFPLENYRSQLEEFYKEKLDYLQPHLKEFITETLSKRLPDMPISNKVDWGIPVPLKEFRGYVINSWFEMMTGHIETTIVYEKKNNISNSLWSKDSDAELIQFFGFDNSFYYAIFYPALLMAAGDYILPKKFYINEFYQLENQKFSTSRNHAVWGSEFINESNSDWVRYYLSLTSPQNTKSNFSMEEYKNVLSDFVENRLLKIVNELKVINGKGEQNYTAEVDQLIKRYEQVFYNCYNSTFDLQNIALHFDKFISEVFALSIYDILSNKDKKIILSALSIFINPVMPNISQEIADSIGNSNTELKWDMILEYLIEPTFTA